MNIGADIVYHNDLYFDAADPHNGSLYLCVPPGTAVETVESLIGLLRTATLWSQEPHKSVADAHKKNYAEQMRFVACAQFKTGDVDLLLARYDHPKFPSSAARWSEWLAVLTTRCAEQTGTQ